METSAKDGIGQDSRNNPFAKMGECLAEGFQDPTENNLEENSTDTDNCCCCCC